VGKTVSEVGSLVDLGVARSRFFCLNNFMCGMEAGWPVEQLPALSDAPRLGVRGSMAHAVRLL